MLPGLLVLKGNQEGLRIELSENQPFWIGRSKECDFMIVNDTGVSSKHCLLLREGPQVAVRDKSTNGILLNGRKLHKQTSLVKPGDIIQVMNSVFQVVDLSPESSLLEGQEATETTSMLTKIYIGPYLRMEAIGSGSFGKVYRAVHKHTKEDVALKVFYDITSMEDVDLDEFVGRLFREIKLLKSLDHPHIIQLRDSGTISLDGKNCIYIALEYFQGSNLHQYTELHKKIPWKTVFKMLYQASTALEFMHSQNILHRDLKPENILYSPEKEETKIVDFGLGKCVSSKERETFYSTQQGTIMGSPCFMSIEQWNSFTKIDSRADIYSLGATVYFLITGVLPYAKKGSNYFEIYYALCQRELDPLSELCPEVPVSFLKIIEKMMEFNAEDRHSSSKELVEEIRSVAEQLKTDEGVDLI